METATLNTNPSPKTKFLDMPKGLIDRHVAMVSSDAFEVACNTALLEYARQMANQDASNLGACASLHLRMLGAQEIIGIILKLHVTSKPSDNGVQRTNLETNQPRR